MNQKLILLLHIILTIQGCRDVKKNGEIDEVKAKNYRKNIGNIDSITRYKGTDVYYIKHSNIRCFIDGISDDGLYYDVRTLPDCKLIEHIHRDSLIN